MFMTQQIEKTNKASDTDFPQMGQIGCPNCNGLGYIIDFSLSTTKHVSLHICECAQTHCFCSQKQPYYAIIDESASSQLKPCAIYPLHLKMDRIRQIYQISDLPWKYKYKFYNSHYQTKYINNKSFLLKINELLPPIWEGEKSHLPKGLFFTGVAGSGKTFLATILMNEIIFRHGVSSLYLKTTRALDRLRGSFHQESATYGLSNDLEKWFSSIPLLVLDDFGAHLGTQWAEETLYDLIDSRYEEGLSTIITSNKSIEELTEVAEGRIASRLKEMCRVVQFPELDIRDIIGQKSIVK